jgi:LPXTG-site transpeptidase (sortase) family protein
MSINSTKIFSWKKAILLCFGIGLLTAGLSVFIQTQNRIVEASAPIGLGSSFEIPGQPVRLLIPIIGVDAIVQSVGLSKTGNGTIGIPDNFVDVAWYNKGSLPGSPGSAIIDGHLDGKKVPKAVFYNLNKLKPGDLVEVIDSKGTIFQFKVIRSQIYDYRASTADIFSGDVSKTRLNLITCTGSWIKDQKLYNKRIVIFTELI